MNNWLEIFSIVSAVIVACYCGFAMLSIKGWNQIKLFIPSPDKPLSTKVTIIIPARNEEQNIVACLESIVNQTYSQELYEIIVIDDDSADKTHALVDRFKEDRTYKNVRLIHQQTHPDIVSHKKKAIETGIQLANGNLIITTDADCIVHKDWLQYIVSYYETFKPKMIVGPVAFLKADSLFTKLQSYEFNVIGLMTGAAISYNNPIMSNGANLVYEKEAFNAVNGFNEISYLASGDDVLLMNKFKKIFPNEIHYIKAKEAIVLTKPVNSLIEFIQQRVRWASKNFRNSSLTPSILGLIIILSNIIPLAGVLITLFYGKFIAVFIGLWIAKFITDIILLNTAGNFFNNNIILTTIFIMELVYPCYLLLILLFSLRGKYIWKNRRVN